ncbi:hypothetical protein CFP65_0072 [Kitasatospora sp. MMS16-BH015]|uniref:hypothetical protein n=1 Tax=Kitasatospora sp. MMS16-BH015 TaxID=2018025 RepID=UPI000CA3E266|nr:hypothetical protein [Kitasatospora sp. MMS16-BH015]AUG75058.1 hypothetical protein CFP65_0072 [Kitasatospora sp. MMS16-BH015]
MSLVILDPDGRHAADYPAWLGDSGLPLRLVTNRPVAHPGYAEVTVVERYARGPGVELAVLGYARYGQLTALIALDPADQVRAGGLRDHLGLPGQGRTAALLLADAMTAHDALARAGVPVARRAELRRVADLHWWAHHWGYPLVVRARRGPDRPVLGALPDEAALRCFAAGPVFPDNPAVVPALTVEPLAAPVPAPAELDAAVVAALPADCGHPYTVTAVRVGTHWLVHDLRYDPTARSARALARSQAGLAPVAEG